MGRTQIDKRYGTGPNNIEPNLGVGPLAFFNGSGIYNNEPSNFNTRSGGVGSYSKGAMNGLGSKQQKGGPWCEHCRKSRHQEDTCWDLHGKQTGWKPRQNIKNRGYQASIDHQTTNFNSEQIQQL